MTRHKKKAPFLTVYTVSTVDDKQRCDAAADVVRADFDKFVALVICILSLHTARQADTNAQNQA